MALTEGTGSKSNKGVTHLVSTFILYTPFLQLAKTQHILSLQFCSTCYFFSLFIGNGFSPPPQFYFSVIAVMSTRFEVVSTCHKSYVSKIKAEK